MHQQQRPRLPVKSFRFQQHIMEKHSLPRIHLFSLRVVIRMHCRLNLKVAPISNHMQFSRYGSWATTLCLRKSQRDRTVIWTNGHDYFLLQQLQNTRNQFDERERVIKQAMKERRLMSEKQQPFLHSVSNTGRYPLCLLLLSSHCYSLPLKSRSFTVLLYHCQSIASLSSPNKIERQFFSCSFSCHRLIAFSNTGAGQTPRVYILSLYYSVMV